MFGNRVGMALGCTLLGMSTTYPSDLTDAEWECAQRYLPPLSRRGTPRTHPLRHILDAVFYVVRVGGDDVLQVLRPTSRGDDGVAPLQRRLDERAAEPAG